MTKARHKWKKQVETEYGTKPHKCVKCGIRKFWRAGNYQAWEYYWDTCIEAMDGSNYWQTNQTWQRPECVALTHTPNLGGVTQET